MQKGVIEEYRRASMYHQYPLAADSAIAFNDIEQINAVAETRQAHIQRVAVGRNSLHQVAQHIVDLHGFDVVFGLDAHLGIGRIGIDQ